MKKLILIILTVFIVGLFAQGCGDEQAEGDNPCANAGDAQPCAAAESPNQAKIDKLDKKIAKNEKRLARAEKKGNKKKIKKYKKRLKKLKKKRAKLM